MAAIFVLTSVTLAAGQAPGDRTDYNSGAFLYRAFCASCHGERGLGDGPVANLGPPPPDITLLRQRNGGVFNRADVRATLDGTRPLPAHQPDGMLNWREVFRKVERADERKISERIEALVSHVESLQR